MLTRNTKVQLLDHARQLFFEGGLGSVNLREVARRTGVSATAVYRHFADKADLMRAVVLEGFSRFDEALASASDGGTARERIVHLAEAYWTFALAHPQDYHVLFETVDTVGYRQLSSETREAEVRSFERLAVVCRSLDPVSGPALALQVWTLLHGAASLVLAGRLPPELGRQTWSNALDQMIPPGEPR
jgi:AcrR family transcriptional regulator